ncbi:hypothetical protein K458DRAFT_387377 [Lentithecium fluviatile CBS 122367]|uniref:Uncharacterized protein n=1 Tax=Lentithecium fluviatile CBS 122367 TaxID=1168545 RepID=A0A6G1J7I6_9PLEO|nr:hypothetical protein K458DRAFT_387377 [Lentithecium fluviatile CBS 122367]
MIGMATPESVAARFVRPEHSHETTTSASTNMQSFQEWGYSTERGGEAAISVGMGPDLDVPLQSLIIDPKMVSEEGKTILVRWKHYRATTHDEVDYSPTRAQFRTLFNVNQGVIIAWNEFGPKHMGSQQHPPVTTLPQLRNRADIVFLNWQCIVQERHQSLGRLRYIFSADVENSHTKDAIARLLGERLDGTACQRYLWDNRKKFLPEDEGYRSLRASPNGRGAALLLITHKATFGQRKMIESVQLWCAHTGGQINLLLTVKEHEEGDDDGEPDGAGSPIFTADPVNVRDAS